MEGKQITPEEQAKREQRLRDQGMFEGVRDVGYPGEVPFYRWTDEDMDRQ